MKTLKDISVRDLRKLLKIRERIEALDKQAAHIIGGTEPPAELKPSNGTTRKWTPAAKARLSKSMKAVWRNRRGGITSVKA